MKEARLILPMNLVVHISTIVEIIVKEFGGVTHYSAHGHWMDAKDIVVSEPVNVFDIAYSPTDAADMKLYDIANQFRQEMDQQEVYLRYGNGHVQMVNGWACMDNGDGHSFDWERIRKELEPNAPDDMGEIIPDTTHPVAA